MRYHDNLPTIEDAQSESNCGEIDTDHVAILATVPCDDVTKAIKEIKIVSWNLDYDGRACGYAPLGKSDDKSNTAQREQKFKNIANSLKLFVTENNPHIIALQEIQNTKVDEANDKIILIDLIQKTLGDDWMPVYANCALISVESKPTASQLRNLLPSADDGYIIFGDKIYYANKWEAIVKELENVDVALFKDLKKATSVDNILSDPQLKLIETYTANAGHKRNPIISDKGNGNILLYNRKYFENARELPEEYSMSGNASRLKFNDTEFYVDVLNVHAPFNELPYQHESAIKKFVKEPKLNTKLKEPKLNTKLVVVGDMNVSVVELQDSSPQKNTTSATPNNYRNYCYQGACPIDGCFHSELKDSGKKDSKGDAVKVAQCRQSTFQHLNHKTGKVMQKEELPPIDVSGVPVLQKKEIETYRVLICADEVFFNEGKVIGGKYSLADFDSRIIPTRLARNLNNEQAIAFELSPTLYKVVEITKDYQTIEINNTTKEASKVVFVPENKLAEFVPLLEKVMYRETLQAILNDIDKHNYDLHSGFGIEMDTKEMDKKEIGKKEIVKKRYSDSAAQIKEILESILTPERTISYKTFDSIAVRIEALLIGKCKTTVGFFGLGARDKSTVDLYKSIIRTLDEGKALHQFVSENAAVAKPKKEVLSYVDRMPRPK